MKKQFKLNALLFILSILFAISGCKKELVAELTYAQKIENAKSWYDDQQKGITSTINSSKGREVDMTFKPDWNNARAEIIDGKSVITAKVTSNLSNLLGKTTLFNLIIVENNGSYDARSVIIKSNNIANITPTELYQTSFTDKAIYKNGVKASIDVYDAKFRETKKIEYSQNGRTSTILMNSNKVKVDSDLSKTILSIADCVDWYTITRFYEDGVFIYYELHYLERRCPAGDQPENPDGSGDDPYVSTEYVEDEINWGHVSSDNNGINTVDTTALDLSGIGTALIPVNWTCYTGNGFHFTSYESIRAHKNTGAVSWVIDSAEHNSLTTSNSTDSKGWTVQPSLITFIDQSDWTTARVELKFKDSRSKLRNGTLMQNSREHITNSRWTKEEILK